MKIIASAIMASIIPLTVAPVVAQERTPVRTEPEFIEFPVEICSYFDRTSSLDRTLSEDGMYCDSAPGERTGWGTSGFTEDGYRIAVGASERNSDIHFVLIYANDVQMLSAIYGASGLVEISLGSREFLSEFTPEIRDLRNRLIELQQAGD